MFNKLFPSLAVLLFSSLVVLNLAGCGGNSSNETENANGNSEAEADTKKAELTASTPEEYTQSVVALLAANEPERFIEFAFPTKEELLAFVAAHVPEDRKEQVTEEIDTEYDEQKGKILAAFGEVRKAVETAGGDWKSLKVTATNYDLQTRDGVTETDINVVISAGNKTIEMKLDDCLLINGRWYSMDEMEFRGARENPKPQIISSDGEEVVGPRAKLTASTPEEFAQAVIALLAANDPNKFIEFVFPAKEELLTSLLKTVSADKRDDLREEIEKDFDEMGKQVLGSFAEVRNEQAEKGCDWKEAKFVGAEYDIETQHGISTTDIEVTFSAGGQTYELTLDDCVLVNGRWYTLDNMR